MASALRRLVLVRHGETIGQSSIRYYGATDIALSEMGCEQMQRVRQALAAEEFDAVYTSALRRTIDAARVIAPQHVPQIVPEFNEVNFGAWEGLTREEIARRDPHLFARWEAALHEFTYPDGDAVPAFRNRVATAWRALHPVAPERVLVVAHKGVLRTILTELLQLSRSARAAWGIDLASIHILSAAARGWVTERANDMRHLDGLR
jgi:broad specificity phosphatase PhoE